jgi:hypothetical protein
LHDVYVEVVMTYRPGTNSPDWVRSKLPPERDKLYGDRLYYVEPGCEYGFREDDGYVWNRISCSYWFGDWIEANGRADQWRIYGGRHRAIYIVREDLMMFIRLKFL